MSCHADPASTLGSVTTPVGTPPSVVEVVGVDEPPRVVGDTPDFDALLQAVSATKAAATDAMRRTTACMTHRPDEEFAPAQNAGSALVLASAVRQIGAAVVPCVSRARTRRKRGRWHRSGY